ncbi:MAG TPA: right-handed parallel beta-helix repeat-containing protein [Kiritimatiellia bacterium]|nr:right-handed parallel beta-helix repeat-containing protein [Kiritimatiellia bacterium]HRZ12686.1 right-handed parallel beta-helix repeat-containing protein [Kiritimatiellia bacterium]HSA19546.1 right-handed parallel beta-helix repeat-containing protein [Kiritimatiellia bacterium]
MNTWFKKALLVAAAAVVSGPAEGATYIVTNSANSGNGTLRAAISNANLGAGTDLVVFNLPAGSRTIAVSTELPRITDRIRITGTNHLASGSEPLVTLRAASAVVTNGLFLGAIGCTVTAMRVHGFEAGIMVTSPSCVIQRSWFMSNTDAGVCIKAGGTQIIGNYFATNDTGIQLVQGTTNSVLANYVGIHPLTGVADGNWRGIFIASDKNYIGSPSADDRNIISGNRLRGIDISWISSSNSIRGNFIGTDAAGTGAVANSEGILINGNDNFIGGTKGASGNLISGNRFNGITMDGLAQSVKRNRIEGNYIGTDVTGSNAIPNDTGIYMEEILCQSNTIGGALTAARNIISGNTNVGINLYYAPQNTIKGNYIGTDVSGRYALGNGSHGIHIEHAWGTTVGGTNAGAGNVISGNGRHGIFIFGELSDDTVIERNHVGVTAAGGLAISNGWSGIMVSGAPLVTIGGIGAGNVVSGNGRYGIYITSANAHDVTVQGNWIGTTASGQGALGNRYEGVYVDDAPSNRIGGVSAAAGNVVSGNGAAGILITGALSVSNVVQSNFIGTDEDGEDPLPNAREGLWLDTLSGCRVGGDLLVGGGNLISANGTDGIRLINCTDCVLLGNRIGAHAEGAEFGGNTDDGIVITGASTNILIGGDVWTEINIISYNGRNGIVLGNSTNTTGIRIDYNWIFDNGGLGIDLGADGVTPNDGGPVYGDGDDGPNGLQNFPVITNVFVDGVDLRLQGFLRSGVSQTYKINFYANTQFDPSGCGEGQISLGSTNVRTSLDTAHFNATVPAPDPVPDYYAATATHIASGDTSEFSHFAMLDSDRDGMPDGWEARYFGSATGGDPAGHGDDDGMPNLDEFYADTDPTDGESFLRIARASTVDYPTHRVTVVTYPSSAYRQYAVEHSDLPGLVTNGWAAGLVGYEAGTGGIATNLDALPPGTTAAVFRVRGMLP